jgi:hypothetical protein
MGEDYTSNPWYKCNAPVFTLELQHNIMIHFGELQEELSRGIQCIAEIRDQLRTPEINNINDIKWLIELLQQLSICPTPQKEWLKTNDLKPLLDEVSEYYDTVAKYHNMKCEIDSIYNNDVYALDVGVYINQIENVISKMFGFFTKDYINTPNDLLNKRQEISKLINDIEKYTKNLLHCSEEMAQVIGVKSPNNILEITKLLKLSDLISKDPRPIRGWFKTNNIDIVKKVINDAKSSYNEIDSNKQELLNVFDKEILNLDAYTYLKKFRTDYSSALRYIKPGYYKDKKAIIGYAKSLSKKMKYEDMVKYIEIAKEIKDSQEYINSNTDKWKDYLGYWYNFEYTKWDELILSQQNAEEIIKLFSPEEVPERLMNILIDSGIKLSEYKSKYLYLEQLFSESNVIYNNIFKKIVIKNDEVVANKDVYKTDMGLLIKWVNEVNDWFIPFCKVYEKILCTFKNGVRRELSDVQLDLSKVKSIIKVEQDIESKNNTLKENYGHFYLGLNTKWQSITSALNWTGKLIKFCQKNLLT